MADTQNPTERERPSPPTPPISAQIAEHSADATSQPELSSNKQVDRSSVEDPVKQSTNLAANPTQVILVPLHQLPIAQQHAIPKASLLQINGTCYVPVSMNSLQNLKSSAEKSQNSTQSSASSSAPSQINQAIGPKALVPPSSINSIVSEIPNSTIHNLPLTTIYGPDDSPPPNTTLTKDFMHLVCSNLKLSFQVVRDRFKDVPSLEQFQLSELKTIIRCIRDTTRINIPLTGNKRTLVIKILQTVMNPEHFASIAPPALMYKSETYSQSRSPMPIGTSLLTDKLRYRAQELNNFCWIWPIGYRTAQTTNEFPTPNINFNSLRVPASICEVKFNPFQLLQSPEYSLHQDPFHRVVCVLAITAFNESIFLEGAIRKHTFDIPPNVWTELEKVVNMASNNSSLEREKSEEDMEEEEEEEEEEECTSDESQLSETVGRKRKRKTTRRKKQKMFTNTENVEVNIKLFGSNKAIFPWYNEFGLRINNQAVPLPVPITRKNKLPRALEIPRLPDITQGLKQSNVIEFRVSKPYSGIAVVEVTEIESISSVIRRLNLEHDEEEDMQDMIRSYLPPINNDEIQESGLKVSLLCPLSQSRIKVPVKGQNCKHVQCCDVHAILEHCRQQQLWNCPICYVTMPFSTIVIDKFMDCILDSVDFDVNEVFVDTQGKVHPLGNTESSLDTETFAVEDKHRKGGVRINLSPLRILELNLEDIESTNSVDIESITVETIIYSANAKIVKHSAQTTGNIDLIVGLTYDGNALPITEPISNYVDWSENELFDAIIQPFDISSLHTQ